MRLAVFLCATLLLTSCGWQLRGYQHGNNAQKPRIENIHLKTSVNNRLLETTVNQQLKDFGIKITPESSNLLVLNDEHVERRPFAYSATGIPLQYQLIMTIRYTFGKKTSSPLEQTLTARRQYDFDTALIVAKKEEERQLLQEMRRELSMRILSSTTELDIQ